jgi:Uma2 family endonuclease
LDFYEKLKDLPQQEWNTFARIVPDFVMEVRSPSDDLEELKAKMKNVWTANGVRLAWLLDPETTTAWIYRADGNEERVSGFDKQLSGEDVLPGFTLPLSILKRNLPK